MKKLFFIRFFQSVYTWFVRHRLYKPLMKVGSFIMHFWILPYLLIQLEHTYPNHLLLVKVFITILHLL